MMDEELENIRLKKNVTLNVEKSSWNRGTSRFPLINKELSYEDNNWLFTIKYEVKISDYLTPNAFSNISDIHKVEIIIRSYSTNMLKFKIVYRSKLNRFFSRNKLKFNVFCKEKKIKQIFYNSKHLKDFYSKVDISASGFEPYIQGLNNKEYFECKLSFYSTKDPLLEFTESLELLNYLILIFSKIPRDYNKLEVG